MITCVFNQKNEFNCSKLNKWRSSPEYAISKDNTMNIIDYVNDATKVM